MFAFYIYLHNSIYVRQSFETNGSYNDDYCYCIDNALYLVHNGCCPLETFKLSKIHVHVCCEKFLVHDTSISVKNNILSNSTENKILNCYSRIHLKKVDVS